MEPLPPSKSKAAAKTNPPARGPSSQPAPPAKPPGLPVKAKIPPLFRKVDWLTMLIAFGVVWVVYFLTLAPEVTLEDSGELCTGAFYAGIPHPPGYPFWSIYAWVWTKLLPIGNVAWRVEVGESTAAAMACGLVGLMVSRGSSMLMEGIEELKGLTGKSESAICLVCGAVAGILLGLGGVTWSESVAINRISLFGLPWVMLVMACLMRWIYAPRQLGYLFVAMFFFGLCTTIHQTLLCAGLGMQVAIYFTRPKLGRTFFLFDSVLCLGVLMLKLSHKVGMMDDMDPTLLLIFSAVLAGSVIAYFLTAILTRITFLELCRDGGLAGLVLLSFAALCVPDPAGKIVCWLLSLACLAVFIGFLVVAAKQGWDPLIVILCGVLVAMGMAFYLYEPISGMTCPPMQWGYPRTLDGFFHALSRGQYEKAHPTDLLHHPQTLVMQVGQLVSGAAEEFNWVLIFVALVPFLFFLKMQKRERNWMIAISSIYFCIGILLVVLMNPQEDKMSVDLHKVFFTSSHGVIALLIGYGLALIAAFMATHYQRFRSLGISLGSITLLPALITVYSGVCRTWFFGENMPSFTELLGIYLAVATSLVMGAMALQRWERSRQPAAVGTGGDDQFFVLLFGTFALLGIAVSVVLLFFGSDSLTLKQVHDVALPELHLKISSLPVFGSMLAFAIVAGFIGALYWFRQRAPLLVTLGLFALLPLSSVMSHWAGSEQRNHWFGYWFGHDMFTPPFVGPDGKLSYDAKLRAEAMKGTNGALVYPEMTRDAVLYGGTDPGRFCPTYMVFCESFTPHPQQPAQDTNFDRRDVYVITQNALADPTYLDYIRSQYNHSAQVNPPFFRELFHLLDAEDVRTYKTNLLARLAYQWLDVPFTALGARVEARRRAEGIYPPKEMYIASGEDLDNIFHEYTSDLSRRYEHDIDPRFEKEPRQIRPGETPVILPGNKLTVQGQVSVMTINGYVTQLMFDKNPTNEFFVEESFPLDWMFPHLTPFGVIMKINRQPLAEIPEEAVRRDHDFWSHYSDRLIGNWITYDTTVKQIVDFCEKVYIRHDYSGFNGDRAFLRDEQAQKSFAKLRSSIAGIYAWRLGLLPQVPTGPPYMCKTQADHDRMLREAEFAYNQAFAYCPYNGEVVYRYIQLLVNNGKIDDACLITDICSRMDPNNGGLKQLLQQLNDMRGGPRSAAGPRPAPGQPPQVSIAELEKIVQDQPTNFRAAFALASDYLQAQQPARCMAVLDSLLTNTNADLTVVASVVNAFGQLHDLPRMEKGVTRLTQVDPSNPEHWYDLAVIQAMHGSTNDALKSLQTAMEGNALRMARDPRATNLQVRAVDDPMLASLHNSPEFKKIVMPAK